MGLSRRNHVEGTETKDHCMMQQLAWRDVQGKVCVLQEAEGSVKHAFNKHFYTLNLHKDCQKCDCCPLPTCAAGWRPGTKQQLSLKLSIHFQKEINGKRNFFD